MVKIKKGRLVELINEPEKYDKDGHVLNKIGKITKIIDEEDKIIMVKRKIRNNKLESKATEECLGITAVYI